MAPDNLCFKNQAWTTTVEETLSKLAALQQKLIYSAIKDILVAGILSKQPLLHFPVI